MIRQPLVQRKRRGRWQIERSEWQPRPHTVTTHLVLCKSAARCKPIRSFSSVTRCWGWALGSLLSWQLEPGCLGHVSWQHSLGEATYTLVGANAPTTKMKFSTNHLTFTTCASPTSQHGSLKARVHQCQASNYCLLGDYLYHRNRYKLVFRFVSWNFFSVEV